MRSLLPVLLFASALALTACDDTVLPISETEACVCGEDGAGCGDDWCSYELALEPSCLGEVQSAEVLIDGHLEAEMLEFESVDGSLVPKLVVPCTRTAPGDETRIDVFAGKWAWSRTGNSCEVPGQVKSILFGCVSE